MTPWRITAHARRRWAELVRTPPGATSDTQLAEYVERTRERYADGTRAPERRSDGRVAFGGPMPYRARIIVDGGGNVVDILPRSLRGRTDAETRSAAQRRRRDRKDATEAASETAPAVSNGAGRDDSTEYTANRPAVNARAGAAVVCTYRMRAEDIAERDRRAAAAGLSPSAYVVDAALGRIHVDPPTVEVTRRTRLLREHLDALESAVGDAHDELSALEELLGLVREDGARIDDPPAPGGPYPRRTGG